MPRSKPPRREKPPAPNAADRARRDRVLAGIADYCRNLSIVCVVAPIVEPALGGAAGSSPLKATIGFALGLVFLAASIMLDARRKD